MDESSLVDTELGTALSGGSEGPPGALDHLGVVELVDLLLVPIVTRRVAAVVIEPGSARHEVRIEPGPDGATSATIATIAPAVGDAAVARLAILARLPLGARDAAVGRFAARLSTDVPGTSPAATDLLVSTRSTPQGLAAAIHRIATAADTAPPAPAGDPERAGAYRLGPEIGRGGMGVVYRGEHVLLEKPVAIKVLHPGLAADPELAAQFLLEARAACRARHPGIVDVTDVGRFADGRAFIVMELIEADTLAQLLRHGPLTAARAIALTRGIASALRAAAAHGVVHRDLKPANVFVLGNDRIKLTDFGVACILDGPAGGPARTIVGTATYMAPEQARGLPTDGRADLYALGCVLFEMLTGRPPFDGATVAETVELHATAPMPPVDTPTGPAPEELVRVIARATAKRPEERYQSADELLAELARVERALEPVGWRRWGA